MSLLEDTIHAAQLARNYAYLMTHDLATEFRNTESEMKGLRNTMADFATDETRLEADVAAETALVSQIQTITSSQATQIQTLTAEVATLQSQGVDTSKLEAALTTFESNNSALTALVPPAPPSGQTVPPTP